MARVVLGALLLLAVPVHAANRYSIAGATKYRRIRGPVTISEFSESQVTLSRERWNLGFVQWTTKVPSVLNARYDEWHLSVDRPTRFHWTKGGGLLGLGIFTRRESGAFVVQP